MFLLLIPVMASFIVKYATIGEFNKVYLCLFMLTLTYFFYHLFLFLNHKVYGKNMHYCYANLNTKILNQLITVDENFTKKVSKGKLLNSINSDVIDIGDMFDMVTEFFMTLIQVIAIFIILLFIISF